MSRINELMKKEESEDVEFKKKWRDVHLKTLSAFANVFYLAGFIELWGSGTKRIVDLCKEQGLPEPDYKEEQGGFSVWFYKDIYTEENLRKIGLNERQIKAVIYVKEKGKITNKEYQKINQVSKATATRGLTDIVEKEIFEMIGVGKREIHYTLCEPKMSQR